MTFRKIIFGRVSALLLCRIFLRPETVSLRHHPRRRKEARPYVRLPPSPPLLRRRPDSPLKPRPRERNPLLRSHPHRARPKRAAPTSARPERNFQKNGREHRKPQGSKPGFAREIYLRKWSQPPGTRGTNLPPGRTSWSFFEWRISPIERREMFPNRAGIRDTWRGRTVNNSS